MPDIVVLSDFFLDCIMRENFKMAAICPGSNNKFVYFWTEKKQLHDFGVYYRVFRYTRSSDLVKNYLRHAGGQHLSNVKR